MTTETDRVQSRLAIKASMSGFGAQMLFLHGHIADPALARRLAGSPATARPRRAWRRLVALLGLFGRGAIRAFPH